MAVWFVRSITLVLLLMVTHSVMGQDRGSYDGPDCDNNEACAQDRVCVDHRCINPCDIGVCGNNTLCQVTNHIPACACQSDYVGHPFTGCSRAQPGVTQNNNGPAGGSHDRFHLYHTTKRNWYQSLSHCNSVGMRLATINSEEEQEELVNLIKQSNVDSNWWLGGSDLGQLGNYVWMSSGTAITYSKFFSPQPDNYIYPTGEVEHCVEVRPSWKFVWNDYLCDYEQYHVCEKYR